MLIYSKYHHWSYKNMIPRISYETYESLTPVEHMSKVETRPLSIDLIPLFVLIKRNK